MEDFVLNICVSLFEKGCVMEVYKRIDVFILVKGNKDQFYMKGMFIFLF